MELSTSALVDALIHAAAFLSVCGGLYGFLLLIARNKFERNILRTILVVAVLLTLRFYLLKAEWASPALVVSILLMLSAVMLVAVLRTNLITTIITPFALIPLLMGMEHMALSLSKRLIPNGVTYAEFSDRAQSAIERSKTNLNSKTTGVDLQGVARRGLDALASLTMRTEVDAMREDFSRGVSLFAERKKWMDSLTPAEKRAYRAEMTAFLAEQGLSEDRYSLQAIREVNPTNLVVLASLFNELQSRDSTEQERVRSIPESLAIIAANLKGVELSSTDMEALREFSELFAKDEMDNAITKAREDIERSEGTDTLAGSVLAAMLQARSGLPIDQLIAAGENTNPMDRETTRDAAAHEKRIKKEELSLDMASETAPITPSRSSTFVEASCPFGVVLIPSDSAEIDNWIVAAQALEIKGYASLGGEVAILRQDGNVCLKGDDLLLDYGGLRFHFEVMSVVRDRVVLKADFLERILE